MVTSRGWVRAEGRLQRCPPPHGGYGRYCLEAMSRLDKGSERKRHREAHADAATDASRRKQARVFTAAHYIPDVDSDADRKLKAQSQFVVGVGVDELRVHPPALGVEGRLLEVPIEPDELYAYCVSSLEARQKLNMYPERDLGIPIEAIDPDAYRVPYEAVLSVKDEALVSGATMLLGQDRLAAIQRRKSSSGGASSVGWFRKPELMSSNVRVSTRVHINELPTREANEEKFSAESVVDSIVESFELRKRDLKHRSKPELQAVEVLPIFPNLDIEHLSHSYVMFDRPPFKPKSGAESSMALQSILLPNREARSNELYVTSSGSKSSGEFGSRIANWCGHYTEQGASIVPDSKDKHFMLLTQSAALYGSLEHRESLKKTANVASLSLAQREQIPGSLVLN